MSNKSRLASFIKTECANWNVGGCIWGDQTCKPLTGTRCGYFEKAVLPMVYPPFSYVEYYSAAAAYQEITNAPVGKGKVRRCQCGGPIKPRARLCKTCRKAREREATRARVRRHRGKASVTL